ncbi:MAG: D-glycero-beta-D-manno-heptose-7-phosphate kinase [Pyrinomonadaceae bacterium]|nr:D-glycero-beta-D-manno-heptose-7-phosphate kinase [Pyrinomonadaceae bacterium]MBP6212767.1 D-glycero-beta-D-manno-heptose-7-phosphate kinase [Pyrinomonadaceae bacterium]
MTELDFTNVKILVVGDVMLDRYWWGSVDRISPEAPVPVVRLGRTSNAAGGAANVAANIAGLGASVILVGITGEDAEAELLRGIVSENPLIVCRFIALESRETTVKTRIVAHNQQVVRLDQETTSQIGLSEAESILKQIIPMIASIDVLVISDYAKGFLTPEITQKLIYLARSNGKPVLIDPKGKDYSKYSGATLLTPNKQEAAEATALNPGTPDLVDRSGEILMRSLNLEALLITRGEEGMTLLQNGHEHRHLAATARKVFDVTGAGDTVIATMSVALGSGLDFYQAAEIANLAAGLVVETVGTTPVTGKMLTDENQ